MRATTIRFPNDLWEQLEREARRQGMVVPGERPYVIHGLGR